MARSGGVAGVQHPRAHPYRDVDARGWYGRRRAAGPGEVGLMCLSNQENDVVVGAVELAFTCKSKHV